MLKRCREFHCLPSQLYAETTDLMRLLTIEEAGQPEGM